MSSTHLSQVFAALSDPTRRAILARLSEGEAPVKELAEPFDVSGPAITKHLKVLERAGLISRSREGQLRPCRLEPKALEPAAEWFEQYRAMWEERFDRLDAFLKSVAPAAPASTGAKPQTRPARTKPKPSKSRPTPRSTAKGNRNGRKE